MGLLIHICVLVILIGHVSCDFRCICNYLPKMPVYSKASLQSRQIGVLDEYMCKFDAQSPLTDWFAIEYKGQVGYIKSTSGMVLRQNCPGSPPKEDSVTSVPVIPSRTIVNTPTSTIKPITTKAASIKPTTVTLTPTSITTTTTGETPTTRTRTTTTSPLPTTTQGDINLCHPDLVRWSKESPIQFLYQYQDKCFSSSFDSGTFDETSLRCKNSGGKMIIISNGAEEKFVERFVSQTIRQPVWIGANTNSSDYKWTSTFGHYTNWAPAVYPMQSSLSAIDSNLYSCSVLDPSLGGKWRLTACTSIQRGICEFPVLITQQSHQSTPRNDVGAFIGNLLAGFRKTTPSVNTHQSSPVFIKGEVTKCPIELQIWARSSPNNLLGQFDRSCYALDKQVKTSFPVAIGICRRFKGHLVDILGHREQDFLQDLLRHHGYSDKVWIGYTDFKVENSFFWTSEARSSYAHWAPSEPSETVLSNRDCTLLNPKNHGLWEARSCETQHTYICEFGTVY